MVRTSRHGVNMIDDLSAIVAAYPHRTAHGRAWESAFVLLQDHTGRLTMVQRVLCHVALMAGPERAALGVIALAGQVLGDRR
jgi:hypothetical protein